MSATVAPAPQLNVSVANIDCQFSVAAGCDDPEWDRFVFAHAEPHHEQTTPWARVRSDYGWKAVRLIMRRDGAIVGGAQILEHRIAPLVTIGYLARGPLLATGADEAAFVDELKRFSRSRRLAYLAISLPYFAQSLVPRFQRVGIEARPAVLPPSVWTKATVVVDLSPDVEALFSGLSETKRKQVRRGQKAGVTVRQGGRGDLRRFEELMLALCRRRGVSSNIPGETFLESLWDAFAPDGHLRLLLAEHHGVAVSALILVAAGGWVRAWRIGWSGDGERLYPNHILYWEAIRWAKENGYRYFDVSGIDLVDAQELLAGRARSAPFKCAITYSKVSLGGTIMLLPGEYCLFPHPVVNFLYRKIGRRLLESRRGAALLGALYKASISRR